MYIVLEGLDGAGTTTQAQALGQALRDRGVDVLLLAEPSDASVGNLIRQALRGRWVHRDGRAIDDATLALLFAADRLDLASEKIAPALARGQWVISDRSYVSSLAYQSAADPTLLPWLATLNAKMLRPDLLFAFRVDVQTCLRRLRARDGEQQAELYEVPERLAEVERAYDRVFASVREREPDLVVVDVDASVSRQDVLAQLMRAIDGVTAGKGP